MTDRSIRCAGLNNWGQLGNGGYSNSSTLVAVTGLTTAVNVGAGIEHTCAVLADGTMRCWGTNYVGQIGNGSMDGSPVPTPVQGLTTVIGSAVGGFHNCALLSDRTVRCWGRNQDGQVGNGDNTTDARTPQPVSGLSGVAALAAGGYHSCALMPDATARCWGRNTRGQLGDGSSLQWSSTPVPVSGLATAVAISGGFYHTCALLQDGTVQCWGDNDSGQIGNTLAYSSVPMTVAGISNAVGVSAGAYHTCALLADGTARCWGRNSNGQLGNGATTNSSSPVTGQRPDRAACGHRGWHSLLRAHGRSVRTMLGLESLRSAWEWQYHRFVDPGGGERNRSHVDEQRHHGREHRCQRTGDRYSSRCCHHQRDRRGGQHHEHITDGQEPRDAVGRTRGDRLGQCQLDSGWNHVRDGLRGVLSRRHVGDADRRGSARIDPRGLDRL